MKQLILVIAAAASLGTALPASAGCGLNDPMSPQCKDGSQQAPAPVTAPEDLPPEIAALAGVKQQPKQYPSTIAPADASGQKECSLYDMQAGRCAINKMTPEEYDRAVDAGVRAASSAMDIQRNIEQRVYGTAGTPTVSSVSFCVMQQLSAREQRALVTRADLLAAGNVCGIR